MKKSYLKQNSVLWGWEIKGLRNFILVFMGKEAGENFTLNLWRNLFLTFGILNWYPLKKVIKVWLCIKRVLL